MRAELPAWCAGCGEPLKRIHETAYVACCSRDYWIKAAYAPNWCPSVLRDGVRYAIMTDPTSHQ